MSSKLRRKRIQRRKLRFAFANFEFFMSSPHSENKNKSSKSWTRRRRNFEYKQKVLFRSRLTGLLFSVLSVFNTNLLFSKAVDEQSKHHSSSLRIVCRFISYVLVEMLFLKSRDVSMIFKHVCKSLAAVPVESPKRLYWCVAKLERLEAVFLISFWLRFSKLSEWFTMIHRYLTWWITSRIIFRLWNWASEHIKKKKTNRNARDMIPCET